MGKLCVIPALLCVFALQANARMQDSTAVRQSERNVMLNAEAASVPRELNIGLPQSGHGAVVFIDGMKAAPAGIPRSHYHWAGGNSYYKAGNYSLMESVIRTGEISSPVNSRTKMGGDSLEGVVTAQTSTNGLIRFDGWLGGPVKKLPGWHFSLGAYVNYDPTSVNSQSCAFVDRKQIYHLNLSRRWKKAELDLMYRFSWCGDQVDGLYSSTPFTYNGDGSITVFQGFRMGYDRYFPADDKVCYMDLETGGMVQTTVAKNNNRRLHDFSLLWNMPSVNGWDFKVSGHLLYMPLCLQSKGSLAGTDLVTADKGYTLPDGTAYAGYVQNRVMQADNFYTLDTELLLEAERQLGTHRLSVGTSLVYADIKEAISTYVLAHTAQANPERICLNGKREWNYNRNALYFKAGRFWTATYIFDKWQPLPALCLLTGVRLKPVFNDIISANCLDGESKNRRVEGFNLADPDLADPHRLNYNKFDYAVSESVNWSFAKGFNAVAEGFYSITNKTPSYFKNTRLPSLSAIGNAQARAGIVYANTWMDLSGVLSYITSWNNASSITVTKQVGGISESIPWMAQYGIGTLGVTVDGNITLGGFKCHVLFTWQDPRYHN